jgi:hypothetical protein
MYQSFPQLAYTATNNSVSGHNSWASSVRLSTILAANPDLVVLDGANDAGGNFCAKALEATIRRIWAARPTCKIMAFNWFAVADQNVNANVNSPTNEAAILELEALCAAYGVTLLDYWGTIQQRVNSEGHNLSEYMGDTIHPDSDGHGEAYALLSPYLPFSGGSKPTSLPSRLYDTNGDYENTPTVKLGTDYDSRSGTWSNNGTEIISSEAGAIVRFSATCQSIGCFRTDGGTNTVEISIDGGAYTAMNFYPNGVEIAGGVRAAHTIDVKVVSGTVKVTQFWAI